MRKHKTKPTGIAWTFREERKREQEKAIRQLQKMKDNIKDLERQLDGKN